MSRRCFRAAAFLSAAAISRMISERRDRMINLWELNYGALIFHVTFNENTLKDSPLITVPTPLPPPLPGSALSGGGGGDVGLECVCVLGGGGTGLSLSPSAPAVR